MKHGTALDGVRGIAILAVVLFHYTFLSCGWAGVQLFFVLSGFLITSILVSDADLPLKLYLQRFYWRRTLRIFPLYFGYLGVLAASYGLTGKPELFGRYWGYLFTYTLNIPRILPNFRDNASFGHFWSLAVEEQFYLVWPLLIFLLTRRGRQALVIALLVLCPVVRALTVHFAAGLSTDTFYLGEAVYSFTPGQLDAFATGAALVVFGDRLRGKAVLWFVLSTVMLLGAGQAAASWSRGRLAFDTGLGYEINMLRGGQHIWGYTLINLWSASLILLALQKKAVGAALSHPVLAFPGRVSYGMYLLHLVVLEAVLGLTGRRHFLGNIAVFAVYLGVLSGVCFLSYRYYESYFLNLKERLFRRPPQARSGAVSASGD